MITNDFKVLAVGDRETNRTTFLHAFQAGRSVSSFEGEFVPTGFDIYNVPPMKVGDQEYAFSVWDLSGEEYSNIRHANYTKTDAFVMFFSITSPDSLTKIETFWNPDTTKYCPEAVKFLVGVYSERRNDEHTLRELAEKGQKPVTYEQGLSMAKKIGAVKYLECSSTSAEEIRSVAKDMMQTLVLSDPVVHPGHKEHRCTVC